MIRMEPNVILKYFEALDAFIKLRVFSDTETSKIIPLESISNRRSYVDLILNLCVVDYHSQILPRLERESTEALYELCIDVNRHLDIRYVALPVEDESTQDTIHLIEQKTRTGWEQDLSMLRSLEDRLQTRVIGQDHAVKTVATAVKRAMTGIRNPERPIGSFFFVGQTGVGKTELAKALNHELFHDRSRMVRVDCSEFSQPHEYAKLIGAPPGYIGHQDGGVLSGALAHGKDLVVLFDEIEKADSKVHDLLLQVLDEGFVTDAKGTRLGFQRAIIILTSNLGVAESKNLQNRPGFDVAGRRDPSAEQLEAETVEAVERNFRPEFVNRIDQVVMFNALGLEACRDIASIVLDEVVRHAENAELRLRYTDDVPAWIAEKGYRPEFGARELRRTVEYEVEVPLSEKLIEGSISRGDRVRIGVKKGTLSFSRN
jgi:ATP-dependent Clp protease ATP-binding subunit ClpC